MHEIIKKFEGTDLVSITEFQDARTTIRATRRLYGRRIDRRGPVEILVRKGRPNYAEQEILAKSHAVFPFILIKKYLPPKKKK